MRKRRLPADRKAEILDYALLLARDVGYQNVSRDALAEKIGCSAALISAYFGTMPNLRRAIMGAAVARSDLIVIAQGLGAGDPKARAATLSTRRAALEKLL